MQSNYKPIGDYIQKLKVRNSEDRYSELLGINIDKFFMPSVANVVGTNLSRYLIVRPGQFACNRMHVGRDYRIPIALSENEKPFIVSPAYDVFEIKDTSILLPEYLMMWYSRAEFDRNAWFYTDADVRGGLAWDAFCSIELPVPSIEKQREIVTEYNVVKNRIKLNEQLNQKLEETAQAIYKRWFVDFEFPNEIGKPYKSSGGAMVYNEELDKEVPKGWEVVPLGNVAHYTKERIEVENLDLLNYVSTDNMLANRKGITTASKLPTSKTLPKFIKGDILISNIRPYFKKIWKADFDGGCSNDILCFKSKNSNYSSYLYAILEQDLFFEYVMSGSKGTKMPRGDKEWIMNYLVAIPPDELLRNFISYVENISQKMNIKISENKLLYEIKSFILSRMSRIKKEKLVTN
ncbi:restriction endonuclease subunit S [Christiangramia sp.]|uniref:restriction endonuclease subunit S n=1 Tax=Christiangramia sp. TaxID=1931228 RepID=UPI002624BFF1|nr:restriction endonuclease subunit S [Christiangramia sp.]